MAKKFGNYSFSALFIPIYFNCFNCLDNNENNGIKKLVELQTIVLLMKFEDKWCYHVWRHNFQYDLSKTREWNALFYIFESCSLLLNMVYFEFITNKLNKILSSLHTELCKNINFDSLFTHFCWVKLKHLGIFSKKVSL